MYGCISFQDGNERVENGYRKEKKKEWNVEHNQVGKDIEWNKQYSHRFMIPIFVFFSIIHKSQKLSLSWLLILKKKKKKLRSNV